ncbi:MAG: DUF2868 domain-containing protein, partial [Burkholderiaceae bacterium]
ADDRQQQVTQRALLLGRRLDLQARLQRAQAVAPWLLLAMAVVVVLAGLGLAGSVVDTQDRRINVLAALVALLGLHALTLAAWLVALLLPGSTFGTPLGRLWLALTARVTLGRGAEPAALVRATTSLLERAKLLPWVLGFASHTIWAMSFAVVIGVLLFAFAFRSYTLSWETTILSPDTFVAGVRALSPLPTLFGFPSPDAATALAATGSAGDQRSWAWWLIGCVTVYGLLARVLCMLLCVAMWHARRARISPDYALPYYRRLFARLDALAPSSVVDADGRPADWRGSSPSSLSLPGKSSDQLAVVGFELPPEVVWPPAYLPTHAAIVRQLAGSAAERQALLDLLARERPRIVVLACHAASSPDRGTERFVRELLAHCGECRLWPVAQPAATDAQVARWRAWLNACGLTQVECDADPGTALRGWDAT